MVCPTWNNRGLISPSPRDNKNKKQTTVRNNHFQDAGTSGNTGQGSLRGRIEMRWALWLAQPSAGRKLSAPGQGGAVQAEQAAPPVEELSWRAESLRRPRWLNFTGQRVRGESCTKNPRDLWRVPLKQSAECWSAHVCKESYPRPGEKQSEMIKEQYLAHIQGQK